MTLPVTGMSKHEHRWKTVFHLDGCHFYSWSYACACGATASTYSERSIADDPYSMVWMDSEGREPCSRCEELIAGAIPKHEKTITPASAPSSSPGEPHDG